GPRPSTSARRPLASGTSAKQQKSWLARRNRITPRCTRNAVGDCLRSTICGSSVMRRRQRHGSRNLVLDRPRPKGPRDEEAQHDERQADAETPAYPPVLGDETEKRRPEQEGDERYLGQRGDVGRGGPVGALGCRRHCEREDDARAHADKPKA